MQSAEDVAIHWSLPLGMGSATMDQTDLEMTYGWKGPPSAPSRSVSALLLKADIASSPRHVCFVPGPDSCTAANRVTIRRPRRRARAATVRFQTCVRGTAWLWKLRRRGLVTARLERPRALVRRCGDTHLSFSLLALGVPDFAPVCPWQLAVQSARAARQSFGNGMSLRSGDSRPMLHAINP